MRRLGPDTGMREALRGQSRQCLMTIGRAREDCNGHAPKDFRPALPVRDLVQIVGAHQPNEFCARQHTLQRSKSVRREARAEPSLELEHADAGVARQPRRGPEPPRQGGHATLRLQGILRRDEPPDLVEAEPLQRFKADVTVAGMGRVERPAQQPDARRRRLAEAERSEVQGRT